MPEHLASLLQSRLPAVQTEVDLRLGVMTSEQAAYLTDQEDTKLDEGRGRRMVSQFGLRKASLYTYDYFYTNLLLRSLRKRRVYTLFFEHEDEVFISPYKTDLALLYVASLYDKRLQRDNDARYKFVLNMRQTNSFTAQWIDQFLHAASLARIRNSPSVRRFVRQSQRSQRSSAGRKRSRQ